MVVREGLRTRRDAEDVRNGFRGAWTQPEARNLQGEEGEVSCPRGPAHMIAPMQNLIDALRSELQQYGEILALLDQQHEAVMVQGVDDILRTIASIHAQGAAIQAAREKREHWQRQLAEALQQAPESEFTRLIPLAPEPYRPLLEALVQENNALLDRVRDRAEQNHLLLRKSLDLLERFITNLDSQAQLVPSQGEVNLVMEETTEPTTHEAIA
jgi:hypothetical protein